MRLSWYFTRRSTQGNQLSDIFRSWENHTRPESPKLFPSARRIHKFMQSQARLLLFFFFLNILLSRVVLKKESTLSHRDQRQKTVPKLQPGHSCNFPFNSQCQSAKCVVKVLYFTPSWFMATLIQNRSINSEALRIYDRCPQAFKTLTMLVCL